jgi:plasmid stabilization system protein ParE
LKALRVHEDARLEASQATEWYAERNPTSARRFRDELLSGFSDAATLPLSFPAYLRGTRRVILGKFPYFIVFFDWQDAVYVVAVAHAKRRPGYWAKRLKQ